MTEAGRSSFWLQRNLMRTACPMRRSRLREQKERTMRSIVGLLSVGSGWHVGHRLARAART
jgi:hypothetical protein